MLKIIRSYFDCATVATDVEKIGFSEGAGMPFSAIPSAEGGLYFEIEAEEGYSLHPRDVFSHQMLSGRIGTLNTLTVAGHRLYVPSTSAIGVKATATEGST